MVAPAPGWYFKMEQEFWVLSFVLVLLRIAGFFLGFAGEMSFETRSPPFFQSIQHLNKDVFPFLPASGSWSCFLVTVGSWTPLYLSNSGMGLFFFSYKNNVYGEADCKIQRRWVWRSNLYVKTIDKSFVIWEDHFSPPSFNPLLS